MIALFLVCLLALLAALEYFQGDRQIRHLIFDYCFDTDLAEPGETITMTSSLRNTGRFPVLYAGLSQYVSKDIVLLPQGKSGRRTISSRFGENRVNYTMVLPAHRKFTDQLRFTASRRGVYTMGKYFLEAGDYLGLRAATRSGAMDRKIVIMPEKSSNISALHALGGLLGDISVRRYLFEDPVLTVGCRDYTGSDPMRSIAWNQTARTGKLQVKIYDHTVEANATVILNLEGGTEAELEETLRLTRSVCDMLESRRIPYDFYTNGDIRTAYEDLSWLAAGLGPRHYNAIMYGLGASALEQLDTFSQLIDRCMKNRKNNNVFILVTPPLSESRNADLDRLRAFSDYEVCVVTAASDGEGGAAQ